MDARSAGIGGLSIREALDEFEARGFQGQFSPQGEGRLACHACGRAYRASEFRLRGLRRVEGASDPDDMAAVAAIECKHCGARGTVTFHVGAEADAADGEAMRLLEDDREARMRLGRDDAALVRDSGWLDHRDDL